MGDLKNREKIGTTFLGWHAEELRKLSATTKRTMTSFIDEAINDLFNKYGIEKPKEPTNNK